MKVGEITRTKWYAFADGVFSFHTAHEMDDHGMLTRRTIFRARSDTWPSVRAQEKGISYTFMLGSTPEEVELWLNEHPTYKVLDTQDIKINYESILVD